MPPIDDDAEPFFYLVEHLFRVGPSAAGEVLTFEEIAAWAGLNGYDLSGWEAETLRSLSNAYLCEIHAAEDGKRLPPYTPAEPVIDRAEVSNRILEAFKLLAGGDVSPKPPTPERVTRRRARP